MLCRHRQLQRLGNTSAAFLILVFVAGCASLRSTSSNRLDAANRAGGRSLPNVRRRSCQAV